MLFEAGDIIWVRFPFEDRPEEKERPALFWCYSGDGVLASRITKKYHNDGWQLPIPAGYETGLLVDSFVRVNKTVVIPQDKIVRPAPIGNVNKIQLMIIKDLLNCYFASL